jgi:hypothetical protein
VQPAADCFLAVAQFRSDVYPAKEEFSTSLGLNAGQFHVVASVLPSVGTPLGSMDLIPASVDSQYILQAGEIA